MQAHHFLVNRARRLRRRTFVAVSAAVIVVSGFAIASPAQATAGPRCTYGSSSGNVQTCVYVEGPNGTTQRRLPLGKRGGINRRTHAGSLSPRPERPDQMRRVRKASGRRYPLLRLVATGQKCNPRRLLREYIPAQQRWF